jgi:hypothetical protein
VPNSANLRPIPFERGNRLGERHGFYVAALAPLESDEVEEIASAIRERTPLDAQALEPLVQLVAGQVWRRRKAYLDLEANGVVRARGKAASILRDLTTLERSILDGLKALALTPQSAADLGLTLKRVQEPDRDVDLTRLTEAQRRKLSELLAIVSSNGD